MRKPSISFHHFVKKHYHDSDWFRLIQWIPVIDYYHVFYEFEFVCIYQFTTKDIYTEEKKQGGSE